MTARYYVLLFLISFIVILAVAAFQSVPGYMDADYYFAGGLQLANGKGLTEPFLWNYLDDPTGLPHSSHAYWMPLASLVAALGMSLTGILDFSTARIGFLLLAGLVSPLTAALSYRLTANGKWAIISGLLAVFSGFYLPFVTTTDTFAIYMLLGAAFFYVLCFTFHTSSQIRLLAPLLLGLLAGLMHLTRADGVLWLLIALFAVSGQPSAVSSQRSAVSSQRSAVVGHLTWLFLGYLLVMTPWMFRNLTVFGTPLSPGGLRTLWLTDYDELFSYPADQLTFGHWWSSGIREISRTRFWALGINLQRTLAEQGMIFLTPLILLGMWRLRADLRVRTGFWGWLLTFGLMTLIFPFAGARGGLFHSCAALQPLFWAATPVGLDIFVEWGARVRGWNIRHTRLIFGGAIIIFAMLLSALVVGQRVVGTDPGNPVWGNTAVAYTRLEAELHALGAASGNVVMVKNPPGYFAASRRPAIAIPDGDVETLLAVAKRFHAVYLLLEQDHSLGLDDLYHHPQQANPQLHYLTTMDTTHIFVLK